MQISPKLLESFFKMVILNTFAQAVNVKMFLYDPPWLLATIPASIALMGITVREFLTLYKVRLEASIFEIPSDCDQDVIEQEWVVHTSKNGDTTIRNGNQGSSYQLLNLGRDEYKLAKYIVALHNRQLND